MLYNKMPEVLSTDNDLGGVVAQANQLANMILLALRTVHEYIEPRAASHGIKLSAREAHAWAVSLSIALSQSKAHYRMPATRLAKPVQKKAPVKSVPSPKTELFPRSERPLEPSKTLHKVRQMMSVASMNEVELLSILRESGCQEAMFATSLSQIPDKVMQLCIERWETVQELAEVGRQDNGEAA
jgi:hypothetical protein